MDENKTDAVNETKKKSKRGRKKGSKNVAKRVVRRRRRRSTAQAARYAVITALPSNFVEGEIVIVNRFNYEISGKGRKLKKSIAQFETFDNLDDAVSKSREIVRA